MILSQEKYENKIVKCCKKPDMKYLLSCLGNSNESYDWVSEHLTDFIGKLIISSSDKEYVLDLVTPSYKYKTRFSSVICVSLLNNLEVNESLMLKYGDLSELICDKWLLEYLYEIKRYDLIDVMIVNKKTEIRRLLFTYKYYGSNNYLVIKYVEDKLQTFHSSNKNETFEKIVISTESSNSYELVAKNIELIKINGMTIDQFIKQNTDFIEKIEIVSSENFTIDSCNLWNIDKSEIRISSVCCFSLYFNDLPNMHYNLLWLSDSEYYDFLQRHRRINNKYIWSYDNTNITNNYFKFVGLEEKIKHKKDLDYNHFLSDSDLLDIKDIIISCGLSDSLYKNLIDLVTDLKKIPNLEQLSLSFKEFSTKEYDISILNELTNLKKIKLRSEYEEVSLLNVDKLARSGLTLVVDGIGDNIFGFNDIDVKKMKQIFIMAGAEFKIDNCRY